MKKSLLLIATFLFIACFSSTLKSQTIVTIAGTGTSGYNGDGIAATTATLASPYGIGVDNVVNVYTADYYNNRVRKINTAGIIYTLAGTGVAGYSGDGGNATAAQVSQPADVCWSSVTGNIYIADEVNNRIRMVNSSGIITTIAGNGVMGYGGDGGQATAAELHYPFGVVCDAAGNLFIAEYQGERIRKVDAAGIITTYAGNGTAGYSGDGGQATAAQLNAPLKVALDPSGNLYIADAYNHRIRKVTTGGIITTYAGTGVGGFSGDGGQATAAQLNWPFGVGADGAGNVYVCDFNNARIRMIKTTGIINTIVGNGTSGFNGDGTPATTKEIYDPSKVVFDASGTMYLSEYGNHRDRKITNIPLPVTLISFDATYVSQNHAVLCKWTVATQVNNKQFTVEKTTDFTNWQEVGTIQGAGTTSQSANYSMQDDNPFSGTSYYRLKQTDYDGHQATFQPVAVSVIASIGAVQLYPNPVNANATLAYNSASGEPVSITILDAMGRTIRTETPTVQQGDNTLSVTTSDLAKGIYFMRIISSTQNTTLKFIKD